MRILYGIVGEGMGHAIRSKAVIDHLIHERGHDVTVVVSGRAYDTLKKYFPDVRDIWGFTMTYRSSHGHPAIAGPCQSCRYHGNITASPDDHPNGKNGLFESRRKELYDFGRID